jgi:mannose-6-phosphate isomerase-like protein (cupin superfamily)
MRRAWRRKAGRAAMRKKTFQALREAAKVGAYAEKPMLPDDKQVQVHLSRNDRPQPFYLICGKDSLLALMSGAATVEFKGTAIDHFALKPGSFVYVPAGAPHRIVPSESSVTLRYKQMQAGLEGVAWYCDGCDAEVYREVWDTETTVPQAKYEEISSHFAADVSLRTCRQCGEVHPAPDLAGFAWSEMAHEIAAVSSAT